jgi:protein-disulfide isomerase
MAAVRAISLTWPKLVLFGLVVALLGTLGGWLAARASMGQIVHDYVLDHPEILPQAMENLRKNEDAKQLAGLRGDVEKPFPGAVLGNPDGTTVLVEFVDYACGYCQRSVADLHELIAENPELKVVIRELPILSPQSFDAARMALAAAEQGKYAAFHDAMFEAGKPDGSTIDAAAQAAGLDLERARKALADPRFDAEIDRNMTLARQLGFQGTPSWVIGDRLLSGAVGKEALAEAISEARG